MLTWEQIVPKWAKKATKTAWRKLTLKQKQNFFRRLKSAKYCFVGEAHGYDSSYTYMERGTVLNCRICNRLCGFVDGLCEPFAKDTKKHTSYKASEMTMRPDWNAFEKRKAEFVKHWNEVHIHVPGQKRHKV